VEIGLKGEQALSGLKWFNNDAQAAFTRVYVQAGEKGGPPAVGEDAVVIESAAGPSLGWGEVSLAMGARSETGTLYAIFVLPAGKEREGEGAGGGPGMGYWVNGGGCPGYVSQDGEEWAELGGRITLAVQPLIQNGGGIVLASARKGPSAPLVEVEPQPDIETQGVPRYSTELLPAVPNPFNPTTQVRFTLAEAGPVTVKVYNLRGGMVRELVAGTLAAGAHSVEWAGVDGNGRPVASGVYVVEVVAQGEQRTKRIALVR
jgi:hypothetical protein